MAAIGEQGAFQDEELSELAAERRAKTVVTAGPIAVQQMTDEHFSECFGDNLPRD